MFPPFFFLSFILAQSRDFGSVLSDFLTYLVSGCRQKVSLNTAIYSLLPAFRWISPDEVAASSKVKQFCLTWLFQVMENNSVWFKEKEFIRRIKGRRWEEARKWEPRQGLASELLWLECCLCYWQCTITVNLLFAIESKAVITPHPCYWQRIMKFHLCATLWR